MSKVSIIGAGNVGATAAMKLAAMNVIDELVLLDIKEGFAEGKAMDIMQCAIAEKFNTDVTGVTNDYSATANSDVIVITSGVPRKPGMTREQLVGINSSIMKSVVEGCDKYSPNAVYVVVSNPMDTMTYQVIQILKYLHEGELASKDFIDYDKRVIGMGGMLDTSRFKYFIYTALKKKGVNVSMDSITANVYGGHGDTTMVPDYIYATVHVNGNTKNLNDFFTEDEISEIVNNTMKGGATLTNLLGTSAWEAPGANIASLVRAIVTGNPNFGAVCSVYRPEYGVCIGTFITTKKTGVKDIYSSIDSVLVDKFNASIVAVKKVNEALPEI
jgi:malate dehydrogenase